MCAFEFALEIFEVILSIEFFLFLKLLDLDILGLFVLEACNRDLMSINGGGVMILGELSVERLPTDSSVTDLRRNAELRSGSGGGTGECNEVFDILNETLVGE